MRRRIARLSAKEVVNKKEPGYYCDGGGLYLQVSDSGSKSWIFRYTLHSRNRHMRLGPFHTLSLADARSAAAQCRQLLLKKIYPIAARDAEHARQSLEAARSMTFSDVLPKN
jgi:hypothetical protein